MQARPVARRLVLALALGLLGWELFVLSDPMRGRPDDFVAFWSSARVLRAGGNPYDPGAVLAVERTVNWTAPHAYRVWEPPWAFALFMPFALLPYQIGRALWFAIHLVVIAGAADQAWAIYGGAATRRGLAWVVAFLFMPTVLVWRTGQLTGLVLLGLVWFLVCERSRRDLMAGAALALAGIKPHVAYLLWPVLAVWCATTRRWRVIAGGLGVAAAATVFALSYRVSLLEDFVTSATLDPPRQGASTLGTVLRLASQGLLGEDAYGLNFVAPAIGLGWALQHVVRRRVDWSWPSELPTLVLVSLATAPFAWIYDEVTAVLPLIQVVALWSVSGTAAPWSAVLWLAGFDLVVLAMNVSRVDPFWYVWTPFALLGFHVSYRAAGPSWARATG